VVYVLDVYNTQEPNSALRKVCRVPLKQVFEVSCNRGEVTLTRAQAWVLSRWRVKITGVRYTQSRKLGFALV